MCIYIHVYIYIFICIHIYICCRKTYMNFYTNRTAKTTFQSIIFTGLNTGTREEVLLGTFCRWLLGVGFEASALFDRNKCMVRPGGDDTSQTGVQREKMMTWDLEVHYSLSTRTERIGSNFRTKGSRIQRLSLTPCAQISVPHAKRTTRGTRGWLTGEGQRWLFLPFSCC